MRRRGHYRCSRTQTWCTACMGCDEEGACYTNQRHGNWQRRHTTYLSLETQVQPGGGDSRAEGALAMVGMLPHSTPFREAAVRPAASSPAAATNGTRRAIMLGMRGVARGDGRPLPLVLAVRRTTSTVSCRGLRLSETRLPLSLPSAAATPVKLATVDCRGRCQRVAATTQQQCDSSRWWCSCPLVATSDTTNGSKSKSLPTRPNHAQRQRYTGG